MKKIACRCRPKLCRGLGFSLVARGFFCYIFIFAWIGLLDWDEDEEGELKMNIENLKCKA